MARAATFDRAVRKEAETLIQQARYLVARRKGPSGRTDELAQVTQRAEKALAAGDVATLRQLLPPLDGLVDELSEPAGKSVTREYTESIAVAIIIALLLRAFVIEAFKIPSSSMYPTLEIGDHIFVSKFLYGVRIPFSEAKILQVRPPKRGEVAVFLWPCNHDRDYIKRIVAVAGDSVEVRCNVLYVNGVAVPATLVNPSDSFEDNGPQLVSRYREKVGEFTYETFHANTRPAEDVRRAAEGSRVSYGDNSDFPELRESPPKPPLCEDQLDKRDLDASRPAQVAGQLVRTAELEKVGACGQQLHYVVPPGHVFGMGDDRWNSNDSRKWGSIPVENLKGKAMFIWFSYSHWSPFDWKGVRWSRIGNFVH
jgi:signal peptidase I